MGTGTELGVGGAPFNMGAVPADVRVELLSTREPYRPRIQLALGPYHVQAGAPGYETSSGWSTLGIHRTASSWIVPRAPWRKRRGPKGAKRWRRSGPWILRNPDGTVSEGSYGEGRRSGAWVIRHADGWVDDGAYVAGKRSGQWVSRIPDGTVYEGSYVDGYRNGEWVRRRPDGRTETETWVDGVEQ